MDRLNAGQLRTREVDEKLRAAIKRNPIYIILDDVLDTYNVGAIFRLADACAVKKIYLCGATETPPNPKIKKASVNTWKWVDWEYEKTASDAVLKLKTSTSAVASADRQNSKFKTIAIEQHKSSIPLKEYQPQFPLAIVVGNESFGVSKDILRLADEIVELPMFGVNKSLNVMVTLGIVLYRVIEYL
ncbi:hypothetical protein A3D78_06430 [Candidatus Gottesmanbacteria bacterium RIFCSPHIGHO2_02_FULL_39_14]|uniref:tRNA/rRNA methyltransferase SpoU type domain-containing protein n=1 Tax=Candidatus Gottesmanbacteria bacterium RIFCSPHIGHO2_02_FULL_39_14 TaxID=1798383 RepID=A0A1F5ZWM5_9BACT|nr:MAG: hypothetical protein A3D78_06430 [Candidatus Gottesmanbacteria bacterium RIFCSPHIGHO2_02_FULL_39_14]